MLTEWAGLSPVLVSEIIVVIAFLTCAIFGVGDSNGRTAVRSHWRFLSLALLLVVIFRIPPHGTFFHGTEYEDSYVYAVSGHGVQMPSTSASPYLISTCVVGSLLSCESRQTYSGHYIGFPAVLRLASRWHRYTPALSNWVNLLASCVAIVAVFLICMLLSREAIAPIAACIVFCSTPIFAIYGMASFAEPFSNACIAVVLYLYLRFVSSPHENRKLEWLNWIALTTTMLLAVTVKRENIILALCLPLAASSVFLLERDTDRINLSKFKWTLLTSMVVLLFCVSELQFAGSLRKEVIEFGGFPFEVSNFRTLGPALAKSFFLPEWYSCTVLLVVAGLVATLLRRGLMILPTVLCLFYWALYTTHVRSYYLLHGGRASPDDTFRYSMNLMSLWSILAGLGVAEIVKHQKDVFKKRIGTTVAVASMYVLLCYGIVVNLRNESKQEELRVRITPAIAASKYASDLGTSETFIVTLEPLVIQMFADPNVNVISLEDIDTALLRNLQAGHPSLNLLYLRESTYAKGEAKDRYARQTECLDEMRQDDLYSDSAFAVIQITVPAGDRLKCDQPTALPAVSP